MKPTQEQIDAALRYASDDEKTMTGDGELLDNWEQLRCVDNLLADRFSASAQILAAAYRQLKAENGNKKPVAWMRKWYFDQETPTKIKNEKGRWVWPAKYKFVPVSANKCLPDDIPLFT
jgi:hypothetical protein